MRGLGEGEKWILILASIFAVIILLMLVFSFLQEHKLLAGTFPGVA